MWTCIASPELVLAGQGHKQLSNCNTYQGYFLYTQFCSNLLDTASCWLKFCRDYKKNIGFLDIKTLSLMGLDAFCSEMYKVQSLGILIGTVQIP